MKNLYHRLLLLIAGSTQKELASQIRYLKIENDVLRSKLPKRVPVTDKERNKLVKFGAKLGKALGELVTIVHPDTLRRWIREAGKQAKRKAAKVGRPKTREEIRKLIIKLARENDWGYTRILGELRKLGIKAVSRNTVKSIEAAWKQSSKGQLFGAEDFPWQNVSLLHVKDVLAGLLPSAGMSIDAFEFNYDRAAEEFLNRQDAADLLPRCNALFIDEAQDMGPSTLKLLLSIVEQFDPEDDNSRSAHIFYDNAQNIYGRHTPRWSEFGVDMRGRSTIMKESFRSTNPVTEFAVNMLHRLSPSSTRQDQAELMSMGLMERTERNGQEWLSVKYNQVFGPKPFFRKFASVDQELQSIGFHLKHLITKEGVSPEDICLIYNGQKAVELLESRLGPAMADIGVEISIQTSRSFQRQSNTLLVTTSHSFKGYEAEVVLIPCADQYVTGDNQILANNLYVAMTRARSLLAVYSLDESNAVVRQVNAAFQFCIDALDATPSIVSTDDDIDGEDA